MAEDYRDLLEDGNFKLSNEIVGLSGFEVEKLIDALSYYNLPIKVDSNLFTEDSRYENIVFEDLTKIVYDELTVRYDRVLTLYAYKGVIFEGNLVRYHNFEDHETEEDLIGFEGDDDLTVPVMKYIYDGVSHLM